MVRSPDEDINFFDIVTGVLQRDTLSPYFIILGQDYVLWTPIDLVKENDVGTGGNSIGTNRSTKRYKEESEEVFFLSTFLSFFFLFDQLYLLLVPFV